MSQPMIQPRTYLNVLIVLLMLTLLTVAVSFAPLAGAWHIVIGLIIATAKAALVVLFFMHIIHSTSVPRAVIAASVVGLILLLVLTFTDYVSRGLVPGMPGH